MAKYGEDLNVQDAVSMPFHGACCEELASSEKVGKVERATPSASSMANSATPQGRSLAISLFFQAVFEIYLSQPFALSQ